MTCLLYTSCDSLENGIITLYNRLLSKIRADYDLLLEETDIDAILTGRSTESVSYTHLSGLQCGSAW